MRAGDLGGLVGRGRHFFFVFVVEKVETEKIDCFSLFRATLRSPFPSFSSLFFQFCSQRQRFIDESEARGGVKES